MRAIGLVSVGLMMLTLPVTRGQQCLVCSL
jgi:hypothetical protein